jgi:hypothetical protein
MYYPAPVAGRGADPDRFAAPPVATSVTASALVAALLCGVDAAVHNVTSSAPVWLLALAIGAAFGALHGVLLGGLLAGLARVSVGIRVPVILTASASIAALLAGRLGAFARMGGPYHREALQVVLGCAVAAGLLSCALIIVARRYTAAPVPSRGSLAARASFSVAVAALAVAAFHSDRTLYVGLYPLAHDALKAAALGLGTLAVVYLAVPWPRQPTRALAFGITSLSAAVVPIVAMSAPHAVVELSAAPYAHRLLQLASRALDFDGDGYTSLLGGGDCDEFDARVHPGAREVPGNGLDDNCLLGDAKAASPVEPAALPPPATGPSPYDVVLITVDSLRPDRLGLYNPKFGPKGRATSPRIDAWAADAMVFERAYASGGWTSISVASMMRGLYPRRLRWLRHYETSRSRLLRGEQRARLEPGERVMWMFPLAWTDPRPTLPALLRRRGMRTVAVVHDGYSAMLSRGLGIERDFDVYVEAERTKGAESQDLAVIQEIERELARTPQGQRLFLWAHFFGVHSGNEVHPGIPVYGRRQADAYDHEVRYFDSLWPRLLNAIAGRGVPTITALTSDHGEVFADPVRMHGFQLSEQDLRVPLIVHVPGWQKRRVAQLASTADLFATLLAWTGTPAPIPNDSLDLTPWAKGDAVAQPRILFADTWRYEGDGRPIIDMAAAFDGQRKLTVDLVKNLYRAHDQGGRVERVRWLDRQVPDPLLDALQRYLEDTGGPPDLHD